MQFLTQEAFDVLTDLLTGLSLGYRRWRIQRQVTHIGFHPSLRATEHAPAIG
jgi:hypothetical protein